MNTIAEKIKQTINREKYGLITEDNSTSEVLKTSDPEKVKQFIEKNRSESINEVMNNIHNHDSFIYLGIDEKGHTTGAIYGNYSELLMLCMSIVDKVKIID